MRSDSNSYHQEYDESISSMPDWMKKSESLSELKKRVDEIVFRAQLVVDRAYELTKLYHTKCDDVYCGCHIRDGIKCKICYLDEEGNEKTTQCSSQACKPF